MKPRFLFSSLMIAALAVVLFASRGISPAEVTVPAETSTIRAAEKPMAEPVPDIRNAAGTNAAQTVKERDAALEALQSAGAKLDERLKEKREAASNAPSDRLKAEIAALEDLKARLDKALGEQRAAMPANPAAAVAGVASNRVIAAVPVERPPEERLIREAQSNACPSGGLSETERQSFRQKLLAKLRPSSKAETSKPVVTAAVKEEKPAAPVVVAAAKPPEKGQAKPTETTPAKSLKKEPAKPAEAMPAAQLVVVEKPVLPARQNVRTTADQSVLALRKVAAEPVYIQCDLSVRPDLVHAKPAKVLEPGEGGPKYAGQWDQGEMSGQGSLTYPNGAQYVGQWKANRMNGSGQFVDPSGWQYLGEWQSGAVEGDGILTHPDGWKYAGQWREGKRNGQGKVTCSDGWEYVGGWANGLMNGEGKLTSPAQGTYVGEWREGKEEGQGTFSYPDGGKYAGQWHNGHREGRGVLSYPDGWQYDGQWANDGLEGRGTLTHPDGWTYTGDWHNGKMNGQGELTTKKPKVDASAK